MGRLARAIGIEQQPTNRELFDRLVAAAEAAQPPVPEGFQRVVYFEAPLRCDTCRSWVYPNDGDPEAHLAWHAAGR